jgi:hypothetical protein
LSFIAATKGALGLAITRFVIKLKNKIAGTRVKKIYRRRHVCKKNKKNHGNTIMFIK